MGSNYKAFIVVILLTVGAFALARPVFTRWMSPADFALRRNVWLAVTTAVFVMPSFWLYMAVAGIIIAFAAKRDTNPAALYLFLLLVIPPLQADLPTFGLVNAVFPLTHFRLLSLVLLIPAALRLHRDGREPRPQGEAPARRLQAADALLFLFVALQFVLFLPYESVTNSMRRALLLLLEIWLPYYVMSRACRDRQMIVEAMAALVLAAIVLAPIAALETLKEWLLYGGLGDGWNIPNTLYLRRGDALRAAATAGHSIVLGYFFAIALGLWLYLQRNLAPGWAWLGLGGLVMGLLAAFARGPWVGALVIVFAYLALGPKALSRSLKGIALMTVVGGIALITPFGAKIIDNLPFIGTVAADTISYRQQLLETSIHLIRQNPFFGSPTFLAQMEDLRTGEGIIDLVNSYAAFALAYGLIGMGLFVGFMGVAVATCWRAVRQLSSDDPDAAMVGASLIACLVGTLVMLATVSNYLSIPYIYLALAGLAVAYARRPGTQPIAEPARQHVVGSFRPQPRSATQFRR